VTANVRPVEFSSGPSLVAPIGWREAAGGAAQIVRTRPALMAVGLLGFLARGGLVAFLLPIVALPTPTGVSNFIGGTALTGAGASDGLIRMLVAAVVLVAGAVITGAVLGAIADLLLAREAVAFALAMNRRIHGQTGGGDIDGEARLAIPITASGVSQVFLIRVATLVPVALAVAWAMSRLVAAGYHELILPDDLSVPLGVRILLQALDAAAVVVAVWLASELVGGLAVRQVILRGHSAPAALLAGFASLARRPVTTLVTYALGVVVVVATAGPTLLISAALWSRLQALLADNMVLLVVPATFAFVLVWGGGLAAVGAAVAWRSLLGSIDVLRAPAGLRAEASPPRPESVAIAMRRAGSGLEDR
jgi:hypothetical protein